LTRDILTIIRPETCALARSRLSLLLALEVAPTSWKRNQMRHQVQGAGRGADLARVARQLSGELTEDGFKPLRLMNGAYLQLHAYVLRIAIPCGTLSSAQLHTFARIARKYDRKYSHFTTRQNWERPSKRSSSERTPFGP
jgi:dissimilatory sulfite reductase (desulfoviridin) alpha/beta subunit